MQLFRNDEWYSCDALQLVTKRKYRIRTRNLQNFRLALPFGWHDLFRHTRDHMRIRLHPKRVSTNQRERRRISTVRGWLGVDFYGHSKWDSLPGLQTNLWVFAINNKKYKNNVKITNFFNPDDRTPKYARDLLPNEISILWLLPGWV